MFPYVTPETFELRISRTQLELGLSDTEWTTVLKTILKTESERVEGPEYADDSWREANEVPFVVRDAVVTLAQDSVNQIEEQGLESESVGDRSESYIPTATVRATVKQGLADAGYGTSQNIASVRAMGRY